MNAQIGKNGGKCLRSDGKGCLCPPAAPPSACVACAQGQDLPFLGQVTIAGVTASQGFLPNGTFDMSGDGGSACVRVTVGIGGPPYAETFGYSNALGNVIARFDLRYPDGTLAATWEKEVSATDTTDCTQTVSFDSGDLTYSRPVGFPYFWEFGSATVEYDPT